jgi:hypothetical protein
MFILKPFLFFRDPDSGKEIPIRVLDASKPEDARLIRKYSIPEPQS